MGEQCHLVIPTKAALWPLDRMLRSWRDCTLRRITTRWFVRCSPLTDPAPNLPPRVLIQCGRVPGQLASPVPSFSEDDQKPLTSHVELAPFQHDSPPALSPWEDFDSQRPATSPVTDGAARASSVQRPTTSPSENPFRPLRRRAASRRSISNRPLTSTASLEPLRRQPRHPSCASTPASRASTPASSASFAAPQTEEHFFRPPENRSSPQFSRGAPEERAETPSTPHTQYLQSDYTGRGTTPAGASGGWKQGVESVARKGGLNIRKRTSVLSRSVATNDEFEVPTETRQEDQWCKFWTPSTPAKSTLRQPRSSQMWCEDAEFSPPPPLTGENRKIPALVEAHERPGLVEGPGLVEVLLPTILADQARGETRLNLLRVPNSPHRLVRQLQAPARESMKQQIRQSRVPSMLREAFLALESIKRDGDARGLSPPPGPPKLSFPALQFAVGSLGLEITGAEMKTMLLEALHTHDHDMDRKLNWLEMQAMYLRCRDDPQLPRGIFLLVEFVRAYMMGGRIPAACRGIAKIKTIQASRVLKDSFGGNVVHDALGPAELWNGATSRSPAEPITFSEFCDRDRILVTGQARLRGVLNSTPRNIVDHMKGTPSYRPLMDRFKLLGAQDQCDSARAASAPPFVSQPTPASHKIKRPKRSVYAQGRFL